MSPVSLLNMPTDEFRRSTSLAEVADTHHEREDRMIALVILGVSCFFGGMAALLAFSH